jgi:AraC family transcriptional regulator
MTSLSAVVRKLPGAAKTVWRPHPGSAPGSDALEVFRWRSSEGGLGRRQVIRPLSRYLVNIAVATTRLRLVRDERVVFNGPMPAGMIMVFEPGQAILAEFEAPADFLVFRATDAGLARLLADAKGREDVSRPTLRDFIGRDLLVEQLSRTLLAEGEAFDSRYVEGVASTILMRVASLQRDRPRMAQLPKWRLKRVQDFVAAHIGEVISLTDLADAAGLSRMHFAAQFKSAAGYRPHDYVLMQRIEKAKSLLRIAEMSLAEVALAVGFQTQAHFCTVFKRFAGETPGRWRKENIGRCAPSWPDTDYCDGFDGEMATM